MNKQSCIVIDDYKEEAFKKALQKDDFEDFEVKPNPTVSKCLLIIVKHNSKRTYDLKNLCEKVNKQFKNKKPNG